MIIPEKSKSSVLEFDPTKRDCLSWIKARPGINLMFKQNNGWDTLNYEDHISKLDDGILKFEEEEIGPEPKIDVYVKEHLEISRDAMTISFERRRRDNGRAYRNCDPDKVAARDNDLAKS